VVAGFTVEAAIEIYTILSVLEGLVARLAAVNITEQELAALHRLTAKKPPPGHFDTYVTIFAELNEILNRASRSQRLKQLMDTFSGQLNCVRLVSLITPERQSKAWDEHLSIIEAVAAGDPDLAEARARKHVEGAREACQAWTKQHASPSRT
jgi:DNA-binding GntR family transcriptional regulator